MGSCKSIRFAVLASVLAIGLSVRASYDWAAADPDDFNCRLDLTVDYAGETQGVANLPVLVRLSEAIEGFRFSDFSSADGADLMFTDDDGNRLPHEVDNWNLNGESTVWVLLPSVVRGTTFHLHFGNPLVDVAAPSTGVWADYAGVWHMKEQVDSDSADKSASDSTAHNLNATAAKGGSGNLAEMVSYDEGPVGRARVNSTTKVSKGNYLSVPNYNSLGLGDSFVVSGWFKSTDTASNARLFSRKRTYNTVGGWDVYIQGWSGNNVIVTGAGGLNGGNSSDATQVKAPHVANTWSHVAVVYDGAYTEIYVNGVLAGEGAIEAATDNGRIMAIGSDSNAGQAAWCGLYDEVRLADGVPDAARMAAEYATMAEPGFLSYGRVLSGDLTAPKFGIAPEVALTDGGWTMTATLDYGVGSLYAVAANLATGAATTNLIAADVTAPATVSGAFDGLVEGEAYSFGVYGVNTLGSEAFLAGGHDFLAGAVSVAAVDSAQEAGRVAGHFTVSRPSTDSAKVGDLVVRYRVGGTAVPGLTYEALSGSVTIPAGEASATVEVRPLPNGSVNEDSTVTLEILDGWYVAGASAELTVVNDPTVVGDIYIRYVSPSGSDLNDGLTEQTAFKTIPTAVAALGESGGTVRLARGTYTETNAFACVAAGQSATNEFACVTVAAPVEIVGMTGDPADVIVTANKKTTLARILFLDHPGAVVRDLTIRGGVSGDGDNNSIGGGAVFITSAGGTIDHCIVENGDGKTGTAWDGGGGNVYMEGGRITRSVIRNGLSREHKSGRNGGGAYMTGGIIENSLFYGNTCGYGASVVINGPGKLVNCTVVGHTASNVSGVKASADAAVLNCIIFGNTSTADTTGQTHVWSGTAAAFDHCAGEVAPNDSCLVCDNPFTDSANGDYSLPGSSVCVDAGADYAASGATSATDLAGADRISGPAVDIGCYEYEHQGLQVGFTAEATDGVAPFEAHFTANLLDVIGDYTCRWDFDSDGIWDLEVVNSPLATNLYATAGRGTVTLKVTDEANPDGVTFVREDYVSALPPVMYADIANAAGAEFPYDTPAKAGTNLYELVGWACDGCTVRVADGTYPLTEGAIVLGRGVRVESASGDPRGCVISNAVSMSWNGTPRRVFDINHADAFVAGVTMACGHLQQMPGACVQIGVYGGTVSNCVIRSGRADNYSGDGGGAYMQAGLLTHCEIRDCRCQYSTDRDFGNAASVANGRISNCLMVDCGVGATGGILKLNANAVAENCTVVGGVVPSNGSRAGVEAASSAWVRNVAVAGVTGLDGGEARPWAGTADRFVNCVTDGEAAPNGTCAVASPEDMFVDFARGRYLPRRGGPLEDAGTDAVTVPATDLAGRLRVVGRGGIDIGCYENPKSGLECRIR